MKKEGRKNINKQKKTIEGINYTRKLIGTYKSRKDRKIQIPALRAHSKLIECMVYQFLDSPGHNPQLELLNELYPQRTGNSNQNYIRMITTEPKKRKRTR